WVITDDFNRDGKADLATTNSSNDTISVLLGRGDGTFAASVSYKLQALSNAGHLATGDFNGDKTLDLVAANSNRGDLSVLLGKGDGTFGNATNYVVNPAPTDIATADFNADGRSDIVVLTHGGAVAAVVMAASQNGFNAGLSFQVGGGAGGLTVGDWNG